MGGVEFFVRELKEETDEMIADGIELLESEHYEGALEQLFVEIDKNMELMAWLKSMVLTDLTESGLVTLH